MRKLVMSILASLSLVISLIASTFAFIVMQNEVDVEEINFDIEGEAGLLISLDGVTYKQDITYDELVKKITGETTVAEATAAYRAKKFTGVTLKHDNKKIAYDSNNLPLFVKDNVVNNETHEMVNAVKDQDYLVFDIWLQVLNTNTDKNDFDLYFKEDTKMTANDYTIDLLSPLSAMDRNYQSGESITINPVNAMRMAVVRHDESSVDTHVYEVDDATTPNLGSVALEGSTDPKNDPSKNAMYSYYNNIFPYYPFTSGADPDLEGFDENVVRNNYTADILGKFTYQNGAYNTIHLSIAIWLEGWDADYLMGVPTNSVSVKLGFEVK